MDHNAGRVDLVQADFASLDQVTSMCHTVVDILQRNNNTPSLDILINNAGVYTDTFTRTMDGFELTHQTNVLVPHIVTCLLAEQMSRHGRIINVASLSASSQIDLAALRDVTESTFRGHKAYGDSKLCNIMQTIEQARVIPQEAATVNCLDPGTVNTKMLLQGWGPIGIEVSDANNEVYLATHEDVASSHGEYFVSCRPTTPPRPALDESIRRDMMHMIEEQTGIALATAYHDHDAI
jgi:NAD(P)-dependent dehydrogenase (short-subunit alcohol dehydrogenase family)